MNRTELPRIIVIMPCFNGEKYLQKSLEAFFSQDYSNKQLVVVDGKSTDASHSIIAGFIADGFPIVWDKTPDTGISSAINIGIKHLNDSDVFGYLGADDVLMPNILGEVAYLFRMVGDLDGVFFDSYSYRCESQELYYRKCPTSSFSLKNLIQFGTIAGLQNIYIRGRHVLENRFSERNRYSMDYELYLRLSKSGASNFAYVPKASSINYMHGNISTRFFVDSSTEAVEAAVEHVGYRYAVILRLLRLKWLKIRNRLLLRL